MNLKYFFMHLFRPSWISLQCTSAYHCPLRRGGEIPRRHPSSSPVYIEKYLQLKRTVSVAEKNLDLLDQGPHRIFG